MMRSLLLSLLLLLVVGCGGPGPTHEEETGYKGKARVDPYLAATRFLQHYGFEATSRPGWQRPAHEISVMFIPVSVLKTRALIREIDNWTYNGGHLVVLGERAESWHNDWQKYYNPDKKLIPDNLRNWIKEKGFAINLKDSGTFDTNKINAAGKVHEVFADSSYSVSRHNGDEHLFESTTYGSGRISVLTDARPLRNRYIDEHQNSAFLLTLVNWTGHEGKVLFIRDSNLSFWGLLWAAGWPALVALAIFTIYWLWKNMPGFGPKLALDERSTLRAYDHHLEALGDFHWRLDKASGLLKPLRDSILERAQQQALSAGHHHEDIFAWLGERVGISTDRAQRAMTHEMPGDATAFTRLMADLQTIHFSLP